jgi:hypothetical protein
MGSRESVREEGIGQGHELVGLFACRGEQRGRGPGHGELEELVRREHRRLGRYSDGEDSKFAKRPLEPLEQSRIGPPIFKNGSFSLSF